MLAARHFDQSENFADGAVSYSSRVRESGVLVASFLLEMALPVWRRSHYCRSNCVNTGRPTMKRQMGTCGLVVTVSLVAGLHLLSHTTTSRRQWITMASTGPATDRSNLDCGSLQPAAKAYVALRHISEEGRQKLARTNDAAQRAQIEAQTESLKLEAVKQEGLEPDQYDLIITLVKCEPLLRQKFFSCVSRSTTVDMRSPTLKVL